MTVETALLRAEHIGVRELREHLSARLKETKPLIVTDRGTPTKVIISYQDILELVEMLDEVRDRATLETVRHGRNAIKRKVKGISVSRLFNRIRSSR